MYGIYENGKVIARLVVPMTMKSNQPIFVSDTLSLKRAVTKRVAQRWEIETRLEPLSYSAQDLMVNLVTRGYSEAVQVITPQNIGIIKDRTTVTDAKTTGIALVNASTVNISTTQLLKGTFIRFENHSKVYMVTSVSGNTIGVYPTLRSEVGINVTVKHGDNVIMTCLYDTDTVRGMSFSDGMLMDMGIVKLLEKL